MSRKTFVIDSSVLFYDPTSIMKFDDNDVVIHLNVLEELDKKKKQPTELGKNARAALRFLDSLKEIEGKGTIHEGLSLSNGTHLSIVTETDFPHIGGINNKIILTAKKLQNENYGKEIFLLKIFILLMNFGNFHFGSSFLFFKAIFVESYFCNEKKSKSLQTKL